MTKLGVLIPTYNEAGNIERLVKGLMELELDMDILFIDGLSTDGTIEIIKRIGVSNPRVHLIEVKTKGIGTALVGGMGSETLRNLGLELVVTMDGDHSHDPAHLPDLVEACRNDTVVIGSRYIETDSTLERSVVRDYISSQVNSYTRNTLGIDLKDSTSGYRCYPSEVLSEVVPGLEAEGYAFQIEILRRILDKGYRVVEAPIVFKDREHGKSKLDLSEALRFIGEILTIAKKS